MNGPPIRQKWALSVASCDAKTVFATVADIERYPEFLPGIVSARIVTREETRWLVENAFGFGPVRIRFRSVAELSPPTLLTIRSTDGPWRNLFVRWSVRQDGGGCELSCDAALEFRSPVLAAFAQVATPTVERRVAAAFDRRFISLARDAGDDKRGRGTRE